MMPWHLLTRGHEVCVLQRWQNEGGKWSRWVPRMQRSRLPCSLISYPFGSAHNIREQTWHWSWGSSGFSFRVYSDSLHLSRRANTLQEVCWFWILQAVVAEAQLADILCSFTSERWTLYRYINSLQAVVAEAQLADILCSFTFERWTLYRYINSLLFLPANIYVQAEMSLKGSWFTVCWYYQLHFIDDGMMRLFSVVKLFTQDFVFVWKILLACSFISHNASGHTQIENFFRIQFWQRHQPLAHNVLLSSAKAYGGAPQLQSGRRVRGSARSCRFWS